MTTTLKDCPDTKQSKFKRVRPFNGMMLSEEDYRLEQTYFREKIKLHNRLHGYGIVCGLQIEKIAVTTEELAQNSDKAYSIRLHSGMAIDWNGEEIIVCEDRDVNLRKCIGDIALKKSGKCQASTKPIEMIVGIKYDERPAEPQAIFAPHCGNGEKTVEFSRTCESYNVHLFDVDDPALPQPDSTHPDWSCPLRKELGHAILLGTIEFDKTHITKVESFNDYFHLFPLAYPPGVSESQLIHEPVIDRMTSQAQLINISFVTGMEKDAAANALVEKGFLDERTRFLALEKMPVSFLRHLFQRNASYLPFAGANEEVLLVHDSLNTVLYPVAAPDAVFKNDLKAIVTAAGWVELPNVAGKSRADALSDLKNKGFDETKIKCINFTAPEVLPLQKLLKRRKAEDYLAYTKTDAGLALVHEADVVEFPVIATEEEFKRLGITLRRCNQ